MKWGLEIVDTLMWHIEPYLRLSMDLLLLYLVYLIAKRLRGILKEICHIGNTKMKTIVRKK
jgi:hypothetical protein